MMRLIAVLATVTVAGCSGCAGVLEHTHKKAESQSCDIACGGGFAVSAYDVDSQQFVSVEDPAGDLCVCVAPEDK